MNAFIAQPVKLTNQPYTTNELQQYGIVVDDPNDKDEDILMPYCRMDIGGIRLAGESLCVLIDTGCSNSLLSEKMYHLIREREMIYLRNQLKVELLTAKGKENVNLREVWMIFTFYSIKGEILRFLRKVRIMRGQSVPMLLGSDFLRSKRVLCLTDDRLLLTKDRKLRTYSTDASVPHPAHVFEVKITPKTAHKETRLHATSEWKIPANQTMVIKGACTFPEELQDLDRTKLAILDPFRHKRNSKSQHPIVVTEQYPVTFGQHYDAETSEYFVTLRNGTSQAVVIMKGQHIANLEQMDIDSSESQRPLTAHGKFATAKVVRQVMSCFTATTIPNRINEKIHEQKANLIMAENLQMLKKHTQVQLEKIRTETEERSGDLADVLHAFKSPGDVNSGTPIANDQKETLQTFFTSLKSKGVAKATPNEIRKTSSRPAQPISLQRLLRELNPQYKSQPTKRVGLACQAQYLERKAQKLLNEDETIEFPSRNIPKCFNKEGYFTHTIQEVLEKGNTNTILEFDNEAGKIKSLQEIVDEIDVSHLNPDQQFKVKTLFMGKEKVLSKHKLDIGNTDVLEAEIKLKDTTSVFHQKYQPIPHAVRPQVNEIIDQYIEFDILRPCLEETNHVSNIFVIRKKCGSLDRLIYDARLINMNTVRTPSHVATNSEIVNHFAGCKWITLLDITNAFYSVKLSEKSQPLTSFYDARRRRLCYKRIPMGFINSPAILDAVMGKILGDQEDCFYYVDDVAITTSGTFEHHLMRVNEVFEKLEAGGLKVKASKIRIAVQEVDFLGFTFKKDQFSVPKARIQAINDVPIPHNPTLCKSFLGQISYYRKLVPYFSKIVHPIQKCANMSKNDFQWTPEAEQAFKDIKEVFKQEISCYIPKHDRPFNCYSDASNHTISFIAMQVDNEGQERLVACVSRTLNRSEVRYSTFKKECLAMVYGLISLRFYLNFATTINMYTDARALIFLICAKNANPLLMRIAMTLSSYPLTILHIPGVSNPADYFTRDGNTEPTDVTKARYNYFTEAEAEYFCNRLKSVDKITPEECRLMLNLDSPENPFRKKPAEKRSTILGPKLRQKDNKPVTVPDRNINIPRFHNKHPADKDPMREAKLAKKDRFQPENKDQQTKSSRIKQKVKTQCFATETVDPTPNKQPSETTIDNIAILTQTVRSGRMSLDDFKFAQSQDEMCKQIRDSTELESNTQFKEANGLLYHCNSKGKSTLVLPKSLINAMLFLHHMSIWGQHKSRERMVKDIERDYYFPKLREIVKDYTRHCFFCVYSKNFMEPKQAFGSTPKACYPRALWYFDIASGLPEVNGYKYILCFIDQFSLYTVLVASKSKKTEDILDAFKNHVIARFALPSVLRSDRETGISASETFKQFADQHCIRLMLTASFSPFSNSVAELRVKALKQNLRSIIMSTAKNDWPEHLYLVQLMLNTTPSGYKYSPQQILFGLESNEPKRLLDSEYLETDPDKYAELITAKLKKYWSDMQGIRDKLQQKSRDYANRSRVYKHFQPGDIVYIRNKVIAGPSGLQVKNTGPAEIEHIYPKSSTAEVRDIHTHVRTKQHFAHLVPMTAAGHALPDNWDSLIRETPRGIVS